ncbi:hypothetical protein NDU88_003177 [Pleurodeles waltl]|uniref:Uncharacterized protein n=1 Tax=Pleurodeles waltl TaxID=8319 RepID=A0AAV7PDX3_PLEWA|nr:hypothetical protein NDU88_003177 [Pleurodeles waltl]
MTSSRAKLNAWALATKEDIQLLLVEFCIDISSVCQDFTRFPPDSGQYDCRAHAGQCGLNGMHQKLEKNHELLHDKLNDLEKRFRRNNMRTRGIALSVSQVDLEAYVQALFSHRLHLLDNQLMLLDHTRRVFLAFQQ